MLMMPRYVPVSSGMPRAIAIVFMRRTKRLVPDMAFFYDESPRRSGAPWCPALRAVALDLDVLITHQFLREQFEQHIHQIRQRAIGELE